MIEVIGTEGTEEHAVAQALARSLAELWKGLDASPAEEELVRIAANTKLSGYQVSDIDVVVAARFTKARFFVPRKPVLDRSGAKAMGKKIRVLSFVAAVEVKGQGPAGVRVQGDEVSVAYQGAWKSATDQNVKQVHALARYFKDQWADVHVYRCLALQGLQELPMRGGVAVPAAGAVPLGFSATDFLTALAGVNGVQRWDSGDLFLSSGHPDKVDRVLGSRIFEPITPSRLDRARMDRIAARPPEASRLAALLGRQRIHLRGRGGTGKTVLMLQAAHEAYTLHGRRSLILTYNLALAADIQRLLALMGVPGSSENGGIEVQTAISYVYSWLRRLEVVGDGEAGYEQYDQHCRTALELFDAGALQPADVAMHMASDPWGLEFDAVIIDEAQDWPQAEAELVARIHGASRLALADGVDQLVRGRPTNWRATMERDALAEDLPLVQALRMKRNLGLFANSLAHEGRLKWNLEPNPLAAGGRVILLKGSYSANAALQEELLQEAAEAGNAKIDFLHCVPPSNVLQDDGAGVARSRLGEALRASGHAIWDGVGRAGRKDFPRDINSFRIVQYDSCRGLEGWTTVLEAFDEFWAYKYEMGLSHYSQGDAERFVTSEEAANLEAWRWAMIALTRPIDTLVVSFSDPRGAVAATFARAAEHHADFVEWR